MKALVKRHREPGLWLEDVPKPEYGINDCLIEVLRTGICRTNVHDFRVGDIVSGEGHVVCGHCRNCLAGRRHLCKDTKGVGVNRPGAFAEYLALPQTNVWVHEAANENGNSNRHKISRDVQSIFDPFGNAVHTALQYDVLGEDVLVTGCGPIGCMGVAIARHAGARYVLATDVNPYRLELAKKMGASRVVDVRSEKLADVQKELGMKEGFDVGLEMSGNAAAFRDMIANMAHGGKIAMLGIPPEEMAIDWNAVVFNMLTVKGIYGREMYETWYKMTVMLQSGLSIEPVVTHRFGYREFQKGFDVLRSGASGWDVVMCEEE